MFKVMKGKNLQARIFYPARLLFRFDGKIKNLADKQKLRVQHHQTSFQGMLEVTSLSKKGHNKKHENHAKEKLIDRG